MDESMTRYSVPPLVATLALRPVCHYIPVSYDSDGARIVPVGTSAEVFGNKECSIPYHSHQAIPSPLSVGSTLLGHRALT